MMTNSIITDLSLSLIIFVSSILYRLLEALIIAYIPLAAIQKVTIFNNTTLKSKLCPEIASTTTLLA